MTTLLSTSDVAKIVALQGPQQVFSGLLDYLLSDFLRWQEFDKSARVASHSATGVFVFMATAATEFYTFKYVNGHPGNPLAGEDGYYDGSNVDLVVEIADAREAQRSYEANLKMFDQTRQMSQSLLDLLRR